MRSFQALHSVEQSIHTLYAERKCDVMDQMTVLGTFVLFISRHFYIKRFLCLCSLFYKCFLFRNESTDVFLNICVFFLPHTLIWVCDTRGYFLLHVLTEALTHTEYMCWHWDVYLLLAKNLYAVIDCLSLLQRCVC